MVLILIITRALQKGPSVADTVIGEGNTTAWKMCGLDKSTCLTVFFDLSSSEKSNNPGAMNPQLYLQFLTRYVVESVLCLLSFLLYAMPTSFFDSIHLVITYCTFLFYCSYQNPEGLMLLRVTTVTRRWVDSAANSEVGYVL